MDHRPIGVFDSGVGGLTSVKELHRLLPGEDIVYFGDTGRVPYGTRSAESIRRYAAQDITFLAEQGVKAILAACGTVSSNFTGADYDSLGLDIPFVAIVEPASEAAAAATQNGRIGVLATPASIRSGVYERSIPRYRQGVEVFANAGSLLVPLAENGMTTPGHPITTPALELYLTPLLDKGIDTLLLGCTHYPLLIDSIRALVGEEITLVDAGAAGAAHLRGILEEKGLLSENKTGETRYFVSDTVENFLSVAANFLDGDVGGKCEYVNIDLVDYKKE